MCPGVNTCVPPSGPTNTSIIFLGEAPGKDEDKKGIPFIGKTGREVNEHYLPLAGLSRDNSYFTNTIRCLPVSSDGRLDKTRSKDVALMNSCANHNLYNEITDINPKLIVPMGAFACLALDPNIDLDLHHGIPYQSDIGMLFPMWHPAGGVHEPKKMLQIRTDWVRLRRYLRGVLHVPKDEYPEPDYQEVTTEAELDLINPWLPMAADTEWSKSKGAYCLTYSQMPGTGRLIRASRVDLLERFQRIIEDWQSIIIFHNWMYDKKITGEMKLTFPDQVIRDSMIRAFHLGNIPQGLKALCFRLLGMKMQDFEDLVIPFSTPEILKYYRAAFAIDWPKPEEQLIRQDDGSYKVYKPQGMNTKLKRFFTDYTKNPAKDIFKAWENWEGPTTELIEEELGPWPGMDIAHVPFDLMKHYACRDADGTIRLWPKLEELKEKAMTGIPQENWEV